MSLSWVYLAFLGLGITGLLVGLLNLRRALASTRWPLREAIVLESAIKTTRSAVTGSRYTPMIRYEYHQDGKAYTGQRIMFSGFELSASRKEAENFLVPFGTGARLAVHVAPYNPRVSVIKPGVDRRLSLMLFATAYFIFMGTGGLLGWWN